MEGGVQVVVPLVDADSSTDEEESVLQFVGFDCDVERRVSEVCEGVDVYSGVVDESADDSDAGTHGCVVERSPTRLKPVVDIDHG